MRPVRGRPERLPALPALEAQQVPAHPVGVDLASGEVHVRLADQPPLVARQRHPLGQHVVGVGQTRAAVGPGLVGERHAVLAEQLARRRERRRGSACGGRSGSRRRGSPARSSSPPGRLRSPGGRARRPGGTRDPGTSPTPARRRRSAAARGRAARRAAPALGHSRPCRARELAPSTPRRREPAPSSRWGAPAPRAARPARPRRYRGRAPRSQRPAGAPPAARGKKITRSASRGTSAKLLTSSA